MGTWGLKPWDSDSAADWFDELMDKTELAQHVEQGLLSEVENEYYRDPDAVRAAVGVLILLGHVFIWPAEDWERHLRLAITRMEELLAKGLYEGEEWTQQVQAEIDVLKARLEHREAPELPDKVKWWCF